MNNEIPPMTEPMGRYWEQPSRAAILLDDTHALMTRNTFEQLKDYSCSQPSGVYEGKMWRRNNGSFDHAFLAKGGKPTWMLCWFGYSEKPDHVSNNYREILLVD